MCPFITAGPVEPSSHTWLSCFQHLACHFLSQLLSSKLFFCLNQSVLMTAWTEIKMLIVTANSCTSCVWTLSTVLHVIQMLPSLYICSDTSVLDRTSAHHGCLCMSPLTKPTAVNILESGTTYKRAFSLGVTFLIYLPFYKIDYFLCYFHPK